MDIVLGNKVAKTVIYKSRKQPSIKSQLHSFDYSLFYYIFFEIHKARKKYFGSSTTERKINVDKYQPRRMWLLLLKSTSDVEVIS